ncbi:MAG: ABC transporter ATP-binding protein [Bdellovibrionales bacterium]|nr:ABC transporter ATP-binding protein [Bdellovibrionales bacterium]
MKESARSVGRTSKKLDSPGSRSQSGPIEYVISLKDVSKVFRRSGNLRVSYSTLKSLFLRRERKAAPKKASQTVAIHDLTLRIPRGASMGIIGRNGSGKSTLLKLITGIYRPSAGEVALSGRVAALIELGAGFHPDFTGRENLVLGGAIHGLSKKEIEDRFEEIVSFAGLEDVIDEPVRTYSSGMYMRLGFSLAVHTDPQILLVDEVLAVGDAAFVRKCKEKISELRAQGVTLLLVTHDLSSVERWCDEALWLDKGEVMERGDPRRVVDAYRTFLEIGEEEELERELSDESSSSEESSSDGPQRWGSREIEILDVSLKNAQGEGHHLFHSDEPVSISIRYRSNESVSDVVFGIALRRSDDVVMFGTNTDLEEVELPSLGGEGELVCHIARNGLAEGSYFLDVALHRTDGYPYDYRKGVVPFKVRWPKKSAGVIVPELRWEFSTQGTGGESVTSLRGNGQWHGR